MPGVLQVEALAQTMAVYVAQQEGFGDRIGLFAGIDECRFKRIVQPGDRLRLEVTMEKLGRRFGRGHAVASGRWRGGLRGDPVVHHPARRGAALMAVRIAVARRHPRQRGRARGRPGRHQGRPARSSSPSPATWSSTARARRRCWIGCARSRRPARYVVQGNTDIAVADFDYAAAFPWLDEVPAAPSGRGRVGARAALRRAARLPAPAALRAPHLGRTTLLVLVCHGSPGSQTDGLPRRPRPDRHHRARHAHRRAGHRLRPHPRRRRARARAAS